MIEHDLLRIGSSIRRVSDDRDEILRGLGRAFQCAPNEPLGGAEIAVLDVSEHQCLYRRLLASEPNAEGLEILAQFGQPSNGIAECRMPDVPENGLDRRGPAWVRRWPIFPMRDLVQDAEHERRAKFLRGVDRRSRRDRAYTDGVIVYVVDLLRGRPSAQQESFQSLVPSIKLIQHLSHPGDEHIPNLVPRETGRTCGQTSFALEIREHFHGALWADVQDVLQICGKEQHREHAVIRGEIRVPEFNPALFADRIESGGSCRGSGRTSGRDFGGLYHIEREDTRSRFTCRTVPVRRQRMAPPAPLPDRGNPLPGNGMPYVGPRRACHGPGAVDSGPCTPTRQWRSHDGVIRSKATRKRLRDLAAHPGDTPLDMTAVEAGLLAELDAIMPELREFLEKARRQLAAEDR